MTLEKAIALTAAMIAHRDGYRQVLGPRYEYEVSIARMVLRGYAQEKQVDFASAALAISDQMVEAGVDPRLVISALVDELEECGRIVELQDALRNAVGEVTVQ